MGYRIDLIRKWPGRRDLLHPGIYRVPEDLTEDLAKQMLAAGAATVVLEASEIELASGIGEPPTAAVSNPTRRKRKSRGKAPENKSALG
jgi:hypothetical protein